MSAPEIRKRVTITADGDLLSKGTPNKFLDDIKNFEVRPTDVFVITWPRSGKFDQPINYLKLKVRK